MKKFVELIQRMHKERYSVVLNKIVAEKIPVAFLSVVPPENAIDIAKNLRAQGLNITTLVTLPSPLSDLQLDFDVITLDKISQMHPRPEYILTHDETSGRTALKFAADCKVLTPIRGNTDQIYNIFMNHLQELLEVYESLIDEESKKTFRGYLLGNVSNQIGAFNFARGAHYITEGFIPRPDSVVIDGGVCDGSTSVIFQGLGCKVYGFEMDKQNFEIAKKLAKKKGFVVENFALGSYKHNMKYVHAPGGNIGASQLDVGGSEVAQVTTLDIYIRENNIPRVDCIKLDVEGAEADVLKGATTTIARWKPILILSAYHKWDDFWVLMDLVKSVRSDYEFALRHYTTSREDDGRHFADGTEDILNALGLDPTLQSFGECCLLAR